MAKLLAHPSALILLAINLVPIAGVVFWGWDAFVLLMLYWLETAIIAFWMVVRIAVTPAGALDDLKFGEEKRTISPLGMAAFFTLHSGIFMGVHFLFLWALFAGDWSKRISGVDSFFDQMIVGTGLWVPLLFLFAGRGALMLFDTVKPWLMHWLNLKPPKPEPTILGPGETIIFGLYIRIVVMQVTIIVGAWFAMLVGNAGALIFLIVVKTGVDLSFQLLAQRFHDAWLKAKADEAAKRGA